MYEKLNNSTQYKVGIYIRLSQEDSDKKYEADSESVINQRNILKSYLNSNHYILTEEYIDDGYSGTNFERPGFRKLIADIQNKKINMVIVKDLSRLGRDHVMTGYYIETFFPENEVRFISIMENYDSAKRQASNDSSTFIVACNDYYSKQNSYKIRDVLHTKKIAGEFIGSKPSYGYRRDPNEKGHLIPDPKVADNVRNIFKWFQDGFTLKEIAEKLNALGIETPSTYKNCSRKIEKWNYDTVKSIVQNRIYTGDMVQNKETKINYKSKKRIHLDASNWIIVENTHEPLVDKTTFFEINSKGRYTMPKTKTKREKRLLENLFVCKECGNSLTINYRKSKDCWSINCNRFTRYSINNRCVSHYMLYNSLEEMILKRVKDTLNQFIKKIDLDSLANEIYKEYRLENNTNFKKLDKLIEKREKCYKKLAIMYNDKLENNIEPYTYAFLKKNIDKEIKELNLEIEKLEKEKNQKKILNPNILDIIDTIKKLLSLNPPNREFLLDIIDKIVIDKDRNIDIFYKFGMKDI